MIRILGRHTSSNVQKVLWMLAEIGVSCEREDYGGRHGRTGTAEYLALNPNAVVPTLVDGDFVLWESNSICRYLATKFNSETLYPTALQQRACCERWMDWQLGTLSGVMIPLYIALVRTAPADQDQLVVTALRARAEKTLLILDAALRQRLFLDSDNLTLADVGNGIWTHRWFGLGGSDEQLRNVRAWYTRLCDRPAFQTNVVDAPLE
jgi:glutathione S-transferase